MTASDPKCIRRALNRVRLMAGDGRARATSGDEPAAVATGFADRPAQMLSAPVRSR